ncbi:MAG TPA: TetR/AcrR family transcriptional regulator [Candidatus Dormibacteraeota bacterium]|nr:TetR/AcrR family transcriptional regulator [Candidatus Dormibacteraeota bacterium]
MARTLNLAVHTVRREVFVDAAMRLMLTKGYERMSIQDLLDDVGASRGAFYHYFDSKQALLEAVVDRIADQALAAVAPIVDDPKLPALPKLETFFRGIARWKTERKALMIELINVWASDHNAVAREKVSRTLVARVAPVLAKIVRQGVAEEVFAVASPEETAKMLMALITVFQDELTELFLARQAKTVSLETVERTLAGFTEAFERILGAQAGSIHLNDESTLHEWFG